MSIHTGTEVTRETPAELEAQLQAARKTSRIFAGAACVAALACTYSTSGLIEILHEIKQTNSAASNAPKPRALAPEVRSDLLINMALGGGLALSFAGCLLGLGSSKNREEDLEIALYGTGDGPRP